MRLNFVPAFAFYFQAYPLFSYRLYRKFFLGAVINAAGDTMTEGQDDLLSYELLNKINQP